MAILPYRYEGGGRNAAGDPAKWPTLGIAQVDFGSEHPSKSQGVTGYALVTSLSKFGLHMA